MTRKLSTALLLCVASCAVAQDKAPQKINESDDSFSARYAAAELVAQVRISGVHRDVDGALSEPGMVAVSGYVYAAVPHQVWKGEAAGLIAFRLGLEFCHEKLRRGERYLIFASTDSYGRLQLRSCEAAVLESKATPLLARLREGGNG